MAAISSSFKGFVTFSGASFSGKTTLARALIEKNPMMYCPVISLTTRKAREDDISGEYKHVDSRYLDMLQNAHKLLWRVNYGQHEYATLLHTVDNMIFKDRGWGVMIITPEQVPALRAYVKGQHGNGYAVISFFLNSPPAVELNRRIAIRGKPVDLADRQSTENAWASRAKLIGSFNNITCIDDINDHVNNVELKLGYI